VRGAVAVRCAGADGNPCLDDAYVAGRIVAELSAYLPEWGLGDTAELVRSAASGYGSEIEALGRSSSATSLREYDLFDDVRICARVDAVPSVIEAVALPGGRARAFSAR
jgi:phosphosulfolactate phosphohydrolase-like enzyme